MFLSAYIMYIRLEMTFDIRQRGVQVYSHKKKIKYTVEKAVHRKKQVCARPLYNIIRIRFEKKCGFQNANISLASWLAKKSIKSVEMLSVIILPLKRMTQVNRPDFMRKPNRMDCFRREIWYVVYVCVLREGYDTCERFVRFKTIN